MRFIKSYDKQRNDLVEELIQQGITHEGVLEAIRRVPRHEFVEQAMRHQAYENIALPIGLNQTISQPFTVAYQTMLLDPKPHERILEIGTGSGYQAAVLCEMGAQVFSIERHDLLHRRASELLKSLGYRIVTKCGDGSLGWFTMAPFDGIIVTAGATEQPTELMHQLRLPSPTKPGGRLIIPLGNNKSQIMKRCTRDDLEAFTWEATKAFRFVPFVTK